MSRTSRSVPTLALAALLAGFALTGCSDSKSGAAAVVDGDRIDISTLNSRVEQAADVRADVGAQPVPGVEASRTQLLRIVEGKIIDEAASRAGIVVTNTDIVEQKREWGVDKPGGTIVQAFAEDGISGSAIDDLARREVQLEKLAQANGAADLDSPAGDAAISRVFTETAHSMKITINPRYGEWDPDQGIVATKYDWLTSDPTV